LPIIGIFGDGARSGVTAKRTAKRNSPGAQRVHECVVAVHLRRPYSVRPADRVCSILHRRYEVRERKVADGARGNEELPMNERRYRMNAAECILTGERCGPAYRDLTFALPKSWLSLARQQEAMDELLVIWSNAGSAMSAESSRRLSSRPAPTANYNSRSRLGCNQAGLRTF
jgi:hypothetical protein